MIDPANVTTATTFAGPVVVDNLVIVPCSDANSGTNVTPTQHQTISAFNALTGAFVWRRIIQPAPFGAQGGSSQLLL